MKEVNWKWSWSYRFSQVLGIFPMSVLFCALGWNPWLGLLIQLLGLPLMWFFSERDLRRMKRESDEWLANWKVSL